MTHPSEYYTRAEHAAQLLDTGKDLDAVRAEALVSIAQSLAALAGALEEVATVYVNKN